MGFIFGYFIMGLFLNLNHRHFYRAKCSCYLIDKELTMKVTVRSRLIGSAMFGATFNLVTPVGLDLL